MNHADTMWTARKFVGRWNDRQVLIREIGHIGRDAYADEIRRHGIALLTHLEETGQTLPDSMEELVEIAEGY